jgi:hypothetical protein
LSRFLIFGQTKNKPENSQKIVGKPPPNGKLSSISKKTKGEREFRAVLREVRA